MKSLFNPSARMRVADRIQAEMARRGMAQTQLASLSGYDERTIRTALSGGIVKDATLSAVCKALEIDLDKLVQQSLGVQAPNVAPAALGSYTREGVARYIGQYLTARPALSDLKKR